MQSDSGYRTNALSTGKERLVWGLLSLAFCFRFTYEALLYESFAREGLKGGELMKYEILWPLYVSLAILVLAQIVNRMKNDKNLPGYIPHCMAWTVLLIAIILIIASLVLWVMKEPVLSVIVAVDSFIIFAIIFCSVAVFLRNYTYANKKADYVTVPYGLLAISSLLLIIAFATKTGLETDALIDMVSPNDGRFGIGKGVAAFLVFISGILIVITEISLFGKAGQIREVNIINALSAMSVFSLGAVVFFTSNGLMLTYDIGLQLLATTCSQRLWQPPL